MLHQLYDRIMTLKDIIIEVDITHRCNMHCRHCNRLCNAESFYGASRTYKDMQKKHIDFLCNEITKAPIGLVDMIRIIGGEPLLSKIIDYAVVRFEELKNDGYINQINIVSNGTIEPSSICRPYIVYSPVIVGEMIKQKGSTLSTDEVYQIKNQKHRNVTVAPLDVNAEYSICDRITVCGIQFTAYGFSYTACCFPVMYVNRENHKRFLHHLPLSIDDFFDKDFKEDVCSLCVFAIKDYKMLIMQNHEMQDKNYIGSHWQSLITQNLQCFNEPDTKWIDNHAEEIYNFRDIGLSTKSMRRGKIYRSACLANIQTDPLFKQLITKKRITCIIDLRTNNEYRWNPYDAACLEQCRLIRLPIDTKDREPDFEQKYKLNDKELIQYVYCAQNISNQIHTLFSLINPVEDNILIHCHSGKDRTGCIIALFELLAGVEKETIYEDYLKSKQDTQLHKIDIFLNMVMRFGSIDKYLISCGVSEESINTWKKELRDGTK